MATYMCHPISAVEWMGDDEGLVQNGTLQVLTYLVVLFSSYSLVGAPIPENTPYGTDDSFSLVSHHYQRVYYLIIFGLALLAI